VVDCIDTLSPKVFLIKKTIELGIPIVSSMGAGGKVDPTQVQIGNLWKSYNCNLAY
jgi:tRNA A37 threonylcarbamoyladenosine dehydratase